MTIVLPGGQLRMVLDEKLGTGLTVLLMKQGITSLEQLRYIPDKWLLTVPGIGRYRLRQIRQAVGYRSLAPRRLKDRKVRLRP